MINRSKRASKIEKVCTDIRKNLGINDTNQGIASRHKSYVVDYAIKRKLNPQLIIRILN